MVGNVIRFVLFTCHVFLGAAAVAATVSLNDLCGDCHAERFASCGGFLEGPVVDANGRLWITDVTGDRVLQIDDRGQCTLKVRTGGHPNGAKFRPDGKLLIADHKGLLLYDPQNARLETLPLEYQGKPLNGLNDLAIDGQGGIYLTVPGRSSLSDPSGRIYYRSSSGEVRLIGTGYAFPNGVAVTPDGEAIMMSELAAKRILSLPAVTAKSPFAMQHVFALTAGGVGVDGMAMDAKGRLFAANFGAGELLVYNADAKLIGAITLPEGAGMLVSNVAIGHGYVYITEAQRGEVWRIALKP